MSLTFKTATTLVASCCFSFSPQGVKHVTNWIETLNKSAPPA